MLGHKTCTKCKETKLISDYSTNFGKPRSICKKCYADGNRKYRSENPDKAKQSRNNWRKNNPDNVKGKHINKFWPNLSWKEALDNYNNLLIYQGHKCAICHKPQSLNTFDKRTNKAKDLAVDHCHKTGKVRGLLCDDCNRGLGVFKDNPNFTQSATNYLLKTK